MKTISAVLAVVFLSGGAQALDLSDLGRPTGRTPYDRYFGPVLQVLSNTSGKAPMSEAEELLRRGRGFRYSFTTPYVPQAPDVTEQTRSGDCKAKSLWLASRLNDEGVRFVVGKLREGAKQSHMWLMWNEDGEWWVLDPTINAAPKAASRIGARDWVPLYSYTRNGKLVHAATARYSINWEFPDPIGAVPQRSEPQPWWLRPLAGSFGGSPVPRSSMR